MWAESLKNGKVKFKEQYVDEMTGKKMRVSVVMDKDTARSRKQAQIILNDKIRKKKEDKGTAADGLRLKDLVDLYRKYQKITVRPSTYTRNYHAMNSIMSILGEDVYVNRLNAQYVNSKLLNNGDEAGTINERIERFKALIRWGYENDYISDISWLDKLKKQKDEEKALKLEEKYLEKDDLKKLLDAMTVDKWRYLAELTVLSGMRIGEAIALDMADVDFSEKVIHVSKTFDPVNHCIGYPKTHASYRDVYMQDQLLKLCKEISLYTHEEQMRTGIRSDLFMHDANGEYLNYSSYNVYLKETSERVLGRRITSHFMRHTHVALLAEQEIPLDVISRRLGHSDSKVTKEVYFHVTERLKEKDNEKLQKVQLL